MAFHHRKLLNESYDDPFLQQYCEPFCDVLKNPNGTCPFKCMNLCHPTTCRIPIEIPPPETTIDLPAHADPPQKHHQISLFLTISLSILATVVFFFICYATYKLCSRWYNSRRRRALPVEQEPGPDAFLDEDHGPMVDHHVWYIRTIGLQPSVISAITIVKYKKGEGIIEGTDCSVCLNEFQEEETLRLLPKCNHAFHIPCIDTWLTSHTNCPLCRAGIIINSTTLTSNTEEVVVPNSGLVEENPDAGSSGEEVVEEGSGVEEDMDSRAQIGLIKPMNRSVSFDSSNVGTSSAKNVGINQRLLRLVTITNEGPLVKGSSSIKRSLSCSAKAIYRIHQCFWYSMVHKLNANKTVPFRSISSTSEAVHSEPIINTSHESEDEEEEKDDLKSRIFSLRLPKRSVTNVLQKWVDEGRKITASDLRSISIDLRRSHRYKHALEDA
ncbi:hypothetical protein RD792_016082 [Penstemon davidsonii]|uniref:RING-type E3 ubiquitin transferase n=1 Tax=Penstemon davidsonii TaxID=160366 RepID=A0ABR0CK87_9LAMI|nr:hypothetical protein RD792_016082 [Penstemon davidsonii]